MEYLVPGVAVAVVSMILGAAISGALRGLEVDYWRTEYESMLREMHRQKKRADDLESKT